MDFTFTEEQKMMATAFRELADDVCSAAEIRAAFEGRKDLSSERWARIVEMGLPGILAPESAGGLGLDAVLDDLDALGYTATAFVVPACAVGANHRRDRVWVVAHAGRLGLVQAPAARVAANVPDRTLRWDMPAPFTVGSADGVPDWMDRTRALGNAVVPQIPELIGRAILAHAQSGRSESALQPRDPVP